MSKPLEKQDVLDLILAVLDTVNKRHAESGRHELNRTTLAAVIEEFRIIGVPKAA